MRYCNLNSLYMNDILVEFLDKKFLRESGDHYMITEKGRNVLVLQLQLEEQMR